MALDQEMYTTRKFYVIYSTSSRDAATGQSTYFERVPVVSGANMPLDHWGKGERRTYLL